VHTGRFWNNLYQVQS